MLTRQILMYVLLLTLPALSECVTSTCEIPSVEAGDDATLTIHFGEDLTNETSRDFTLVHQGYIAKGSHIMLSCHFSNGVVECDKTPCCTWESHVTDVFHVYIHNVSEELEGKFWGFVSPADMIEQKYCNFTLKAITCSTDRIIATNSHVICTNQPVITGQSCTVTCSPGHYFRENQTSVTYTCVAKNKWSPEMRVTSCEAYTCPTESITAAKSHMICNNQPVFIGQTCKVNCISGHYFQENQTSVTYTCVWKNKWSPEIPVISCEEPPNSHESYRIYFLFLLLSIIPIAIVLILMKRYRRYRQKKKSDEEERLLPEKEKVKKSAEEMYWLHCMKIWYPELDKKTHFLPPLRSNRDDQVLVPQSSRESQQCHDQDNRISPSKCDSDVIDHRPLQLVLCGMQALADYNEEKEVMFVVSQLQFGNYLGEPIFAPAAALRQYPRSLHVALLPRSGSLSDVLFPRSGSLSDVPFPRSGSLSDVFFPRSGSLSDVLFPRSVSLSDVLLSCSESVPFAILPGTGSLPKYIQYHHYDNGDFDVLLIHRHHILVTLQISSVGQDFKKQKMTDQEEDAVLLKKVDEMIRRLENAAEVLKCLISDLKIKIHIIKCLVMPYITSCHLKRAINRFPSSGKVLCKFLGVQRVDDAVKLCLLSDQLSDINNSSRRALQTWWERSVSAFKQKQSMAIESYEHLVARCCGPATTVEVHCVTAPRLNIRILGKAVSETGERVARLVLFPEQVDILNQSPPRAFVTGPPGTGKTTVLIIQGLIWLQRGYDVHVVSTCDESRAVTIAIEHQLQETTKTPTARSRVHRYQFDLRENRKVENAIKLLKFMSGGRQLCIIADVAVRDYRESFRKFCDQLIKEVHCVYIWGASLHRYTEPFCLQQFNLTIPVRAPAVVTEEVKKSLKIKLYAEVHDYTVNSVNIHTDSDRVMRITHRNGHLGHTSAWPLNCVQCGYEVFRILKELHVGQLGDSKTRSPLQYRDVLVLCDGYPTDDTRDCTGQGISTASGLVRGLRESEIPVRMVIKGDELAIRDTALGAGNLVTVARWRDVLGLERKVVVVETGFGLYDEPLYAMSCCSSQLVLIVPDYDGRKAC